MHGLPTSLYDNVKPKLFTFSWPHNIAPYKILSFHNFTPYYFNIYFLIKFKFYSIIKHLIRILTYYIFFNRNNILFNIYKHNHNKCLILKYIPYINAIWISLYTIIIINFHQEFIFFFLYISFNLCCWQWRKVDGFVIMKPHELEMSHVNYLGFFFFLITLDIRVSVP